VFRIRIGATPLRSLHPPYSHEKGGIQQHDHLPASNKFEHPSRPSVSGSTSPKWSGNNGRRERSLSAAAFKSERLNSSSEDINVWIWGSS